MGVYFSFLKQTALRRVHDGVHVAQSTWLSFVQFKEGWVPSDYVRETIGAHAHQLMQQKVRDLELDVFLSGTNFDAAFYEAIRV